jgi:isochorismate pyruvate lyase
MTMFHFRVIDYIQDVYVANTGETISTKPSEFEVMKELKQFRDDIDAIDNEIAALLGKRFRIAEQVAEVKRKHHIPVRIERRIDEVLRNAERNEVLHKLPDRLGYFLWREIIEATCYHEEEILGITHQDDTEEEY